MHTVSLQVLVIGGKGTNKTAAEKVDGLVEGVILALEDDFDVSEVSQPGEVSIKGAPHMAAVVSVTTETNFTKEAI